MSRGILTNEIQAIAKEYLGREITTKELRLYPYIDYCLKNGGKIDIYKIDDPEYEILLNYDENKLYLAFGGYIKVSKEFYDYIQKVLWLSYVEDKIEENN